LSKQVHARAILHSLDPVVDDASVNIAFNCDSATDFSGVTAVANLMTALFNTTGTGGSAALATYISTVYSRVSSASLIEIYDITAHLNGSAAGSPVAVQAFTLGAALGGTTNYPEGVAATISFRSDYGSDVEFGTGTRPRARDRNRFYLPALASNAFTNDSTTGRCKFSTTFVTNCLASLFTLSNGATVAGQDWVPRVWTRAGAAVKLPTVGFMDDRPDYQRRRSDPNPAGRSTRALASV
jgi:hypothetical protein